MRWAVSLCLCGLAPFAAGNGQKKESAPAHFVDRAEAAGLTREITFGGADRKQYIIETTGTGVALFDYDGDGWLDIFLVNGTTLEAAGKPGEPSSFLYRNNRDGSFTDVTSRLHPPARGWGQGVCVGDYDNDG
ncbi:MAG: FG-GAP repeat domain-containing protein, partial [Candidatus Acidiferrales bacterium]